MDDLPFNPSNRPPKNQCASLLPRNGYLSGEHAMYRSDLWISQLREWTGACRHDPSCSPHPPHTLHRHRQACNEWKGPKCNRTKTDRPCPKVPTMNINNLSDCNGQLYNAAWRPNSTRPWLGHDEPSGRPTDSHRGLFESSQVFDSDLRKPKTTVMWVDSKDGGVWTCPAHLDLRMAFSICSCSLRLFITHVFIEFLPFFS